ncbi:gas vesicle protein GvpO [Haladaptatus caseinilyticus]|uniref:gas vesicle protein GvpO n=1 Tax=Haladaptatus caseinilyticus TaxID=2993314 RepID=UPI00224B238C|nr:gas vesicle protein GvpO [Haladaptatus caseinilyticus]
MSEQSNHADREFDVLLGKLEEAVDATRNETSHERSEMNGEPARTDSNEKIDVRGARDACRDVAEELTGSPLDGIVEVEHEDGEGWRVVAEVIERSSIPDTQDIIGRYVISLDTSGTVLGYGRAGRYRRASFDHQREAIAANEH